MLQITCQKILLPLSPLLICTWGAELKLSALKKTKQSTRIIKKWQNILLCSLQEPNKIERRRSSCAAEEFGGVYLGPSSGVIQPIFKLTFPEKSLSVHATVWPARF